MMIMRRRKRRRKRRRIKSERRMIKEKVELRAYGKGAHAWRQCSPPLR